MTDNISKDKFYIDNKPHKNIILWLAPLAVLLYFFVQAIQENPSNRVLILIIPLVISLVYGIILIIDNRRFIWFTDKSIIIKDQFFREKKYLSWDNIQRITLQAPRIIFVLHKNQKEETRFSYDDKEIIREVLKKHAEDENIEFNLKLVFDQPIFQKSTSGIMGYALLNSFLGFIEGDLVNPYLAIALVIFSIFIISGLIRKIYGRKYCLFATDRIEFKTKRFDDPQSIDWDNIEKLVFDIKNTLLYLKSDGKKNIKSPGWCYQTVRNQLKAYSDQYNFKILE